MKKGTLVAIAVAISVVLAFGCTTFWKMGVAKGEIGLANRYDAQFNVVETTLDTMRKTIMNQHKCTTEWADKFIAVVSEQGSGRPGAFAKAGNAPAGSGLMALGGTGYKESESLGIPDKLYEKLSNSIDGKLAEFKRSQDVLTDVWRAHKTYCEDPFHNWIGLALASKVKEKPVMISSSVTKKAIETKVLDDELM
jgi:hypothetical protein